MHRRRFVLSALASSACFGASAPSEGEPKLLVVDSVGSNLDILSAVSFGRDARIRLPARPREVVTSLDGSTAYVSIYGPGVYGSNPTPGREIAVIDLQSKRLARKIDIMPHSAPHGLAVAPDGMLWVTCETEGAVIVVDPSTRTKGRSVVATVAVGVKGPHWIAITPDGSKVFASNKNNAVISVIDAESRRLSAEIRVPRGVEGLAIAPDGRRLFAADLGRAGLWAIDVHDDRSVREIPLDEPAGRVLATPDGRSIVITRHESGTIEVLDLPDLRRRGIVKIGRTPSGMAISPDGKVLFVGSWIGGSISVVDLDSLRVLRAIHAGSGPDGLAMAAPR